MRILIAEDEAVISMQYQLVLEERGHNVTLSADGVECIEAYKAALSTSPSNGSDTKSVPGGEKQMSDSTCKNSAHKSLPPYDVVILDYRMPRKDGLAVAIEILDLCPSQRIIFASAYTMETLQSAVKHLHRVLELLHKPFDLEYFVEAVEDTTVYEQIERLNARVRDLKNHDLNNSELIHLLDGVKKLKDLVIYNC